MRLIVRSSAGSEVDAVVDVTVGARWIRWTGAPLCLDDARYVARVIDAYQDAMNTEA